MINRIKKLLLLLLITFSLFSTFTSASNEQDKKSYRFFKKQKTTIENPFELRDPFKRMIKRSRSKRKKKFGGVVEGNVFSNLPSIEDVPVEKIVITGVLLGKDRRAIAKVEGGSDVFILREGMKLGMDNAELKAILPGGIVLVEKIRNVYDHDEYLETVIPIQEE